MLTAVEPPVATASQCAHCGLTIPPGNDQDEGPRFCCPGCREAHRIITENGLTAYYDGDDRRPIPVALSDRDYQELDDPAFQRLYVRTLRGHAEVDLYLDNVHCASCVWLVERTPLAVPGTISAELNVPRSLVTIRWDPEQTSLSGIARFLAKIGYPPHPFRGGRAEAERRKEDRAMLVQIAVAGALAVNVMTISLALYAGWFGAMDASWTRYFNWASLLLTLPALVGPGRVFFRSAWAAIRARRPHVDVPIAVALGAGFIRGAINTIQGSGPIYFDAVVTLIFLLLVGRLLQQRAQRRAADSAELLHSLTPATARLVEGDTIREVPVEALLPGMTVDVRAGDTIPADGRILDGATHLDLALLTGESAPAPAGPGTVVFAGTVNVSAPIRIGVDRAGESTRLGAMLRELERGITRRAPITRQADRFASGLLWVVLGLALATWLWWTARGSADALDHAIALLIVTCPCALALATPLAFTVSIGQAARAGILIRGGDSLEALGRPGTMVLDKTGTLTEGKLQLVDWIGADAARRLVLALERHSNHPIALAFQRAWPELSAPESNAQRQTAGGGIEGSTEGRWVVVGSPGFVAGRATDPERIGERIPADHTPVLVAVDGAVVAAAGFTDPIRPDAAASLRRLESRGWRIRILSGDAPGPTAAVARQLGIPAGDASGGASPETKAAEVGRLLEEGPVVMVGDGVNDAPAIGRATVGIGVHGGAEACLAAADVYLTEPGLTPLVALTEGARRTRRMIRNAIAISAAYNAVGATLAMTGVINPLIAAILMPVSSATVTILAAGTRFFETRS